MIIQRIGIQLNMQFFLIYFKKNILQMLIYLVILQHFIWHVYTSLFYMKHLENCISLELLLLKAYELFKWR